MTYKPLKATIPLWLPNPLKTLDKLIHLNSVRFQPIMRYIWIEHDVKLEPRAYLILLDRDLFWTKVLQSML